MTGTDKRPNVSSTSPEESSIFKTMVKKIGDNFLTESWERKYYSEKYSCWPPPLFILTISLIQIIVFLYYHLTHESRDESGKEVSAVPTDSILIYDPDKRYEVWRFLLYIFIHSGWIHLSFNLTVQVLIGLPLEMVNGSTRLAMIYLTGVLAGSLATSVFDPHTILLGASGGVYALLTAHLANVLLNYHQMQMGILRVVAVLLVSKYSV